MYFLIISGMSGAGKSRAVATLEDLGYYCVDNLPIALIPRFAEVCLAATERYERVALVTDVRAGGDFQQLFDSLDSIRDMGCDYRILFLDTDTATLIRRYKETRRRHPLMDKGVSMTAAIEKERTMLSALRNRADFVVDTTGLSAAGLRERLLALFSHRDRRGLRGHRAVLRLQIRHSARERPRVRCALPAQSVLRDEPARAQRHRPRGS